MTVTEQQRKRIKEQLKRRRVTKDFKLPSFPKMVELEYTKAIIKEIKKIDDLVKEILIPELDRITNQEERFDASFKSLSGIALVHAIIQKIKSIFYGEPLTEDAEPTQNLFSRSIRNIVKPFINRVENLTKRQFVNEFKRQTGSEPLEKQVNVEPFLRDALRTNISLIKTIHQDYFSRLSAEVQNAVGKGMLSRDLQEKIINISKISKNRAKLIARDQIGKLVGDIEQARQIKLGVTEYIWRTVRDGRVRSFSNTSGSSDHARLEGTIQKWSNPPVTVFKGKRAGERNHPGKDIVCRCHPQPIYDDITGIAHPDTIKARKKMDKTA